MSLDPYSKILSIIIPVYNRSELLYRCISSITQNFNNRIELVIIDDCSTEIINNEFLSKSLSINFIRTEKNYGPQICRNIGANNAVGKYLYFLDSDDYVDPISLENLINFLTKSDIDALCCNFKIIYNGNKRSLIVNHRSPTFNDEITYINILKNLKCAPLITLIIKKSIFVKINGFDEKLQAGHDDDIFIRVSEIVKIEKYNEYLGVIVQHDGQRISNKRNLSIAEFQLIQKFKNEIKKNFGTKFIRKKILLNYINLNDNGILELNNSIEIHKSDYAYLIFLIITLYIKKLKYNIKLLILKIIINT